MCFSHKYFLVLLERRLTQHGFCRFAFWAEYVADLGMNGENIGLRRPDMLNLCLLWLFYYPQILCGKVIGSTIGAMLFVHLTFPWNARRQVQRILMAQ
jgi:hypothetical protein